MIGRSMDGKWLVLGPHRRVPLDERTREPDFPKAEVMRGGEWVVEPIDIAKGLPDDP